MGYSGHKEAQGVIRGAQGVTGGTRVMGSTRGNKNIEGAQAKIITARRRFALIHNQSSLHKAVQHGE